VPRAAGLIKDEYAVLEESFNARARIRMDEGRLKLTAPYGR